MSTASDRELLDAFAQAGDQRAFAVLVERYRSLVYRVCRRILVDTHEAEDATQAVFVVLMKKASSLRKNGLLASWLHAVARQTALYMARRRVHRSQREVVAGELLAAEGAEAPDAATREALLGVLDRELAALSDRQRQAVILRYLEGHSAGEAAAIAGCEVSALKVRASDGLARLRSRLARQSVALSVPALAAALASEAQAAVPTTVLSSITGASTFAVANAAAGAAGVTGGGTVMSLANATMKAMFVAKVKAIAAVCAAVVVVGAGVPAAVTLAQAAEGKAKAPPATATPLTAPATNAPATAATIAWGEATNGLQVGIVPLGGNTGWKGFLCPDHTNGISDRSMSDEMAARQRCCRVCGAPKPWSATFSEGEPMRMELHVRNLAKEERSLCNAGVRNAPAVCREWQFTFTPAGGGKSWMAVWPLKPFVPPESDLKLGVGDQNEAVLEQHLGGGHWIFADRQGRRISSLPAGKYTVTASYEHTEHEPAKAPIPLSPGAAAEIATRQAARPGGEDPAAKPCPYWHGTVTTAPVEIEIKADDAEARFLDAAKYAGFAAVAEVKALPQAEQAGNAVKLSQLGIEWKELLYAPDTVRQAMAKVTALTLPYLKPGVADAKSVAGLKVGDRILVVADEQSRVTLPGGSSINFADGKGTVNLPENGGGRLDGAQWLLWTQSRQDALQAALAPGWKGANCPWCTLFLNDNRRPPLSQRACQACNKLTALPDNEKLCPSCAAQRGECWTCERTVGPATRDVTFRLWAYDPKAERDLTPRNECRIKDDASFLPLWIEVQNEKDETPEFQTPGGGARFDCCKTLFYLVEGPGLSAPAPVFHGDGGARARMMGPAALQKGSATGRADLIAGTLFTTPGTYTVRAVAGRLISDPVTVVVAVER
jgi:RNA polymerase sigma factor (sigma-70 family)